MSSIPLSNPVAGQILSMNNAAVSSFIKGEAGDAITVLRFALANLRSMLQCQVLSSFQALEKTSFSARKEPPSCSSHCPVSIRHYHPYTRRQFFTVTFEFPNRQDRISDNHSTERSGKRHGDDDGVFAFYNRVFTLSREALNLDSHTENYICIGEGRQAMDPHLIRLQHQNRMLVMLLYNMAVYHHTQGIERGKSSELSTALRLYELAFSLLETCYQDFAVGDQVLLLLSLYNNMGHIHSYFCNTPHAQLCVLWIQRIFHFYYMEQQLNSEQQDQQFSLAQEDFAFFFQYVPMSPDQEGSTAGAA